MTENFSSFGVGRDSLGLVRAAGEAPQDAARALVLADWLEESGNPRMAYACRWMASRGKYPLRRKNRVKWPWSWYRSGPVGTRSQEAVKRKHRHAVLPRVLFDEMPPSGAGLSTDPDTRLVVLRHYYSWLHAAWCLALGLNELRRACDVVPPDLVPLHKDWNTT